MKKNILIVFTGAMEIGGIERSLLGLLESFDFDSYNVDLFLYGHHGSLFPLIDERVNVLPEVVELAYLRESFIEKVRHGCWYSSMLKVVDEIKKRIGKNVENDITWAKVMRRYTSKLEKHYDLALSFFRPFDFLAEKVDADIKIGWIHTDYTKAREPLELLRNDYSRMDYIVGVSDECCESFKELFPEFSEKVLTIQNILSDTFIKQQAELIDVSNEMQEDKVKLLSIGRFCEAKNFDNIPEICSMMINQGMDRFKWYIIGFGTDEQLIREKIQEYNMEDKVFILGKKDNPYPYIKACNIYVQPSRYEGKCVAVIEAQILNKPVVITNYPTAKSQLEDGVDGVIVPMDNEGCTKGIVNVIRDTALRENLVKNTGIRDYTNRNEIKKLYQLIGD